MFEEAYSKLNKAQKEAVDSIEGPVLVIAGPGTGKTQLLSTRVANILKKTDTDAKNILCLTFTNKAATNMQERLMKLAGSAARDVTVKTFHAFSSEIMNSYPEYFWNGANLSNAPETVQYEIIESIISSLPKENPFSVMFDGRYTMVKPALSSIGLAKQAGLTPGKLKAILEINMRYIDEIEPIMVDILSTTLSYKKLPELEAKIEQLPEQLLDKAIAPLMSLSSVIKESLEFAIKQDEGTNKTKHTGKWKAEWVQAVDGVKAMHKQRRANQKWLALADIYEAYRKELHHRGYYDYSDMLLEVIEQMEQNADLRSDIQERFNYVLVDEFQDSNAAQLRLAHLIADHHTANNQPNIMAVGDDDQSIYGFNGAELNNMLHFDRNYDSVKTIVLTENYRSTQAILDTAEKIIEHSEDRLVHRLEEVSKDLLAKNTGVSGGVIKHLVFQDPDHQFTGVAKQIQSEFDQGTKNIAVLARSHDSLVTLAGILNRKGVPIRYEKDQNILELDVIKQIMEITKAINAINSGDEDSLNLSLSKTLVHRMWGLEHELLWKFARDNRYKKAWLTSLGEDSHTQPIKEWLVWLAAKASNEHLAVILEYIIGIRESEEVGFRSPVYKYFIERFEHQPNGEYLQSLSAIRTIRSHVYEFTQANEAQIVDFLQLADTLRDNQVTLSDQSVFVTGEKAVELYSVHKAKGLEFDSVYIIDAVEDNWKPRTNKNKPPANLPLQPPLETLDDYARLMYVAATRAKKNLFLTSYGHNRAGEGVLSSSLIADIEPNNIELQGDSEVVDILEDALRWPRLDTAAEKMLLAGQLESFTVNATNLINFLDVSEGGPKVFLEKNLLRLPTGKSDYMSHGTAMHSALELAQKLVNKKEFSLQKVKNEYSRALKRECLPANNEQVQLEHGFKIIEQLFGALGYKLTEGSAPERELKNIIVGKATISGKLDRIDFLDENSIRIVDYKTGKALRSFETTDKTKEIKAWKHKLQLTLYALIAKNTPTLKQYKNIIGQMAYVEADSAKDLTLEYEPSQADVDRLDKLVNAVYSRVKNYDLPDTSKYEKSLVGIQQFENDLISHMV